MHASPLATDLYQLTMAIGYFERGFRDQVATCEMFVRRLPLARRYLVALGIEETLRYIEELRFGEDDIDFLRSLPSLGPAITPAFADYLRAFRFTGDVWAMEEGTIAFENEPFMRVRTPIIEAQILETYLLSSINHATMIASKGARIVRAAAGRTVVEFGTRRTHPGAAIDATRAAYAVGFAGTSNVEAARRFGIPVLGTAAHMWTMAHPSEEEAFRGYFSVFPESSILLIDTYDTPRGALTAARVCRDKLRGVRLDSGDIGALAVEVRGILDREGAPGAKIVASGDLNEHSIASLLAAGAPIDTFGVGTELVCSVDAPSLGGVYKLVELFDGKETRPIAKFSQGKGTLPGAHQVLRVTDEAGRYQRDVVALEAEEAPVVEGRTLAPTQTMAPLLSRAFEGGKRVRRAATLDEVRAHVASGLAALPIEHHELSSRTSSTPGYSVQPSQRLLALQAEVRERFVSVSESGGSPTGGRSS